MVNETSGELDDDSVDAEIQKALNKISRRFFLWLVVGGLGLGTAGGLGVFRPDPATGTDLRKLETRLEILRDKTEAINVIQTVMDSRMKALERDGAECERRVNKHLEVDR